MMPLEKQSLGLFTHPFRYCRDNPHPPRSDSQFQQGMPQYLCRTGVPTAIHAGEEIKLGCSNGDISAMPRRHSELFMFNGLNRLEALAKSTQSPCTDTAHQAACNPLHFRPGKQGPLDPRMFPEALSYLPNYSPNLLTQLAD